MAFLAALIAPVRVEPSTPATTAGPAGDAMRVDHREVPSLLLGEQFTKGAGRTRRGRPAAARGSSRTDRRWQRGSDPCARSWDL